MFKEIKYIQDVVKPKRYLEVGIEYGSTILNVKAEEKVGIEPVLKLTNYKGCKIYQGTSDDVFASEIFSIEDPFDLIFIDGYHEFRQVVRDVKNSLKFLNKNGVIVCHDVYPFDYIGKYAGLVAKECPGPGLAWCGDVWKLILYVKFCMLDLIFCVVSTFPGYLFSKQANEKRVEAVNGIWDIDFIDSMSVEEGMAYRKFMNIVPLKDVKECLDL